MTDRPLYMENLLSMNDVLKENGFPDGNIKMFYSNGNTGLKGNLSNIHMDSSFYKILTLLYPSTFSPLKGEKNVASTENFNPFVSKYA